MSTDQHSPIIFDCDGVLVDSEALSISLEVGLLEEAGFSVSADEITERFVGMTYSGMIQTLEEEQGRRAPPALRQTIEETVLEAIRSRLTAVSGMKQVLEHLEKRGIPRSVASSSNLDRVALSLEVTGLRGLFESGSLFSAEMVECGKPAPDLFLHTARTLGFDPAACIVIEDSPHGVIAAAAAGMRPIGFLGGSHTGPTLKERLLAAGAQQVVDCAESLLPLLDPNLKRSTVDHPEATE